MTTVQLNTATRKVEVFSSARDTQARTDIAALEARTMADWTYVPDVTGGATRTQAAWNAERMSFADFEAGGGVSAWNRALKWLNAADYRTLFLPDGLTDLDTAALDPITGLRKAIIGRGLSTLLRKPSGSGTDGSIFTLGDGTAASCRQVTLADFQIQQANWSTAESAAFTLDGCNDLILDLPRVNDIAQLLDIGPTVTNARAEITIRSGSWKPEANRHLIHHQRGGNVYVRKCLVLSGAGGTGHAYYLQSAADNTNDGIHLRGFQVGPNGSGLEHILVIDTTNGSVVNFTCEGFAFDHATVAAILLRDQGGGGAHHLTQSWFFNSYSTPASGQAIKLEHNGTGVWRDIRWQGHINTRADSAVDGTHVIETSGTGEMHRIEFDVNIAHRGSATAFDALVKIGNSNVRATIRSGGRGGAGTTPYDYVVETTADIDNVHLDIQDDGAQVGLVDHFAYSSGGSDIIVNGLRYPSEGTFTPTVTFTTPGDLAVAYATQLGRWWKRDGLLFFELTLVFTPTYATASGNLLIQGLPNTPRAPSTHVYSLAIGELSNMTWAASAKAYTARIVGTASSILIRRIRDGAAIQAAGTTEFPSATEYTVAISGSFPID